MTILRVKMGQVPPQASDLQICQGNITWTLHQLSFLLLKMLEVTAEGAAAASVTEMTQPLVCIPRLATCHQILPRDEVSLKNSNLRATLLPAVLLVDGCLVRILLPPLQGLDDICRKQYPYK